jgi:hypothetical protein
MRLGTHPNLACVDPYDTLSPLQLSTRSPLWDKATQQLATIRIIYAKDITMQESDTVFVHLHQELHVPLSFEFERGADTQWKLTVNYRQWFEEVDVLNPGSFANSLINGLEGSLYATP